MKNLQKILKILAIISFCLAGIIPIAKIFIEDSFTLFLHASEFEYFNYGMLIGAIVNLLIDIFIFVTVGYALMAIREILNKLEQK